jgi:Na+-translocating ferredoxin:NAD+ oxidoreductase subunit D
VPWLSNSSPMQHADTSTARMMLLVILALLPGIMLSTWLFGFGLLVNILLCCSTALLLEAALVKLRGRQVSFYLRDYSALVTAVLFSISIPAGSPWWLCVLGIGFAIAIVKHAFGGLGQNAFNPAMAAYVLLLLWFPAEMTGSGGPANTYTNGLPLFARTASDWELVNLTYLLGGLFLLFKRIINWHIPLSIIITVLALASLFYSADTAAIRGTPYYHLFSTATMLGAFFIATDPVSAATSNPARLVYGVIIGSSIYAIRVWGNYPDSIAIAVLFGNFCAPLLDYYLRPRIYGHRRAWLGSGPPLTQQLLEQRQDDEQKQEKIDEVAP